MPLRLVKTVLSSSNLVWFSNSSFREPISLNSGLRIVSKNVLADSVTEINLLETNSEVPSIRSLGKILEREVIDSLYLEITSLSSDKLSLELSISKVLIALDFFSSSLEILSKSDSNLPNFTLAVSVVISSSLEVS